MLASGSTARRRVSPVIRLSKAIVAALGDNLNMRRTKPFSRSTSSVCSPRATLATKSPGCRSQSAGAFCDKDLESAGGNSGRFWVKLREIPKLKADQTKTTLKHNNRRSDTTEKFTDGKVTDYQPSSKFNPW